MPPTIRPASRPREATAARASGKLAPHSKAAGRMAQVERARSIWKVNQGLVESTGLMGQYGSELASMQAVQATAPASSSWQQPRARRGRATPRTSAAATPLPIPKPARNTARMMENV